MAYARKLSLEEALILRHQLTLVPDGVGNFHRIQGTPELVSFEDDLIDLFDAEEPEPLDLSTLSARYTSKALLDEDFDSDKQLYDIHELCFMGRAPAQGGWRA